MTEPRHDRVLRQVLSDIDAVPGTVSAPFGEDAPVSHVAAEKLNARLLTVAAMHTAAELTDAQFLAAVRSLADACEVTSVLQHMLQPEQMAAARARSLEELTSDDLVALRSISA